MMDLNDLYREVIVDHNRSPRNFRQMADATCMAAGHNPLCGDQLTLFLKLRDDVIEDVSFQGSGCAISMASASLMTEILKGKSESEATRLFDKFHALVTDAGDETDPDLGKLAVLAGVRQYPSRIKCAVLSWHAMNAALHGETRASTE
ncbi:MAG: SUF system NifU family Fe-S cluster assembly protein [Gammaproteobacteria bacterium]|nr:SUF system NifU family Fe-S cluster assembly protein [Gammaproteobacteria bacterium]MCG3142824.1 Zinc-dependent sulfurtransferase SufU [Gammaproteobacteria bacterium]